MRLLLIDDDELLMETLAEALIKQRYAVDIAVDGETAQEFLALFSYDLLVLDMRLPDVEGVSLCRQLRTEGTESPILMLSANDDSTAKVQALDAGADDYVIKPFDFDELCARIRALLRRESPGLTATLRWGDLSLKPDTFEVFYGEHLLHTTPKEYALLELFLRHPSRVFSLDTIIENLWSFQDPPGEDAVRTHVKGLRQKLKAGGAPKDIIETVYGLGYRLNPRDTAPANVASSATLVTDALPDAPALSPRSLPPSVPTPSDIAAAIATAWETHRGTMQERLAVLEALVAAMNIGELSPELRQSGCAQAHKLAGALGCFGFPEGSRLARELELLLLPNTRLEQHSPHISAVVGRLRQQLDSEATAAVPVAVEAIASRRSQDFQALTELWIVGASDSVNQALVAIASATGLCSAVLSDPSQGCNRLQDQPPAVILLWLDETSLDEATMLLERLPQATDYGLDLYPSPPISKTLIIAITDIQDFHQRLRLVQQGTDRILSPSLSPQGIIEIVQQMRQVDQGGAKVMIVDDDAQVLDLLRTLLSPWGFQLTTLDNLAQLQPLLETVQPDLLVLDVEMPEANGLEICQVLRADETWWQLPILFLTVHEETSIQQQAFGVGADDFVSKSAMSRELPLRILNRLKR